MPASEVMFLKGTVCLRNRDNFVIRYVLAGLSSSSHRLHGLSRVAFILRTAHDTSKFCVLEPAAGLWLRPPSAARGPVKRFRFDGDAERSAPMGRGGDMRATNAFRITELLRVMLLHFTFKIKNRIQSLSRFLSYSRDVMTENFRISI